MWTDQIEAILKSDPVSAPQFGGVYPCNTLPQTLPYGKCLYVANTDPAGKPGEHWVAFYFHPNGTCYYFDSYGLPPLRQSFLDFMQRNAKSWVYNMQRLQQPESDVCGHYCIFFGLHMCRGKTMQGLLKIFDANKKLNDLIVIDFIEHYYPMMVGASHPSPYNQRCTCASMSNFLFP